MSKTRVMALVLVVLTVMQGCKQKQPEPIPGPKAAKEAVGHFHAAGIAWFQESIEEAFSRTEAANRPMVSEAARPRQAVPAPRSRGA